MHKIYTQHKHNYIYQTLTQFPSLEALAFSIVDQITPNTRKFQIFCIFLDNPDFIFEFYDLGCVYLSLFLEIITRGDDQWNKQVKWVRVE